MNKAISQPSSLIHCYPSAALEVIYGVNEGDRLSFAEELAEGDVYRLTPRARQVRLGVEIRNNDQAVVAHSSGAGAAGATLHLDSCLTFMSPDGHTTDVLVIVEIGEADTLNEIYALPLAPLRPRIDYQLVGIDTENAHRRLAEVTGVAFTRGTNITLSNGMQCPIEELKVGDSVLTRDDGPQQVRWIGQNTVRATGELSPIMIKAGTLGNIRDLVVSPDHRLFIYQRNDALGIGRHEVLVRARHLINGESVCWQPGGYVDYFQILFDRHEIIYAEGIAAETLLLDAGTRATLPPELSSELSRRRNVEARSLRREYEVSARAVRRSDAIEVLRRASGVSPRRATPPDEAASGK